MLRINLATRPFYNERPVHLGLVLLALLVLGFTAFNAYRIVTLSTQQTELNGAVQRAERQILDLDGETASVQRRLGGVQFQQLADAAREANQLIDQRTFSWTQFFNLIESNLPPDVMITSVRPLAEDDGITIQLVAIGRQVEGLGLFMERLESTGAFEELLSRQEEVTDEGLYKAELQGRYRADAVRASATGSEGQ